MVTTDDADLVSRPRHPQGQGVRARLPGRWAAQDHDHEHQGKAWERVVAGVARLHIPDPLEGAIGVRLLFTFERPPSHYRANGTLAPKALAFPGHHLGDLDKLVRSVLDGLTGVAFGDDCQVTALTASKSYGSDPGVHIRVSSERDTHTSMEL